jgi:hypothetical protein
MGTAKGLRALQATDARQAVHAPGPRARAVQAKEARSAGARGENSADDRLKGRTGTSGENCACNRGEGSVCKRGEGIIFFVIDIRSALKIAMRMGWENGVSNFVGCENCEAVIFGVC